MASRFTASANFFFRRIAIPALLVAYGVYLVMDFRRPENPDREPVYKAKLVQIGLESEGLGGLILGGSNAYYAVSARSLSERFGYRWYNFTLLSEGYSEASYKRAIADALPSQEVRDGIKTVVYSSILLLHRSQIAQFRGNADDTILVGEAERVLSLRPREPAFQGLGARRNREDDDPERVPNMMSDSFGDIDFSTARCKRNVRPSVTRLEDPDVALDYYDEMAEYLTGLYPAATLYMVVPSEYLTEPETYRQWGETLLARWHERGARPYRLIVQPSTPDASYTCGMSHHTNAKGQAWRTADLIAQMEE